MSQAAQGLKCGLTYLLAGACGKFQAIREMHRVGQVRRKRRWVELQESLVNQGLFHKFGVGRHR